MFRYVLVLGLLIYGIAPRGRSAVDVPAPPDLTPELAKAAMVAMIQSPDPGPLHDFPLERFIVIPAEYYPDNPESGHWSLFSLRLADREYTYQRSTVNGLSISQYKGTFELKNNVWTASPPHIEWQACRR